MRTPPAGKAPVARRVDYVLRDMMDRIRRLEMRHGTPVQVGSWRIEEEGSDLVAFHTVTKKRVVLATKENP